jgi:plastocyanin
MDPMKSRRWIAAAALAAAVVFLVMVTGEHGPAAPETTPAAVSSSGTVQPSGGGPPDKDDKDKNDGDARAGGGGQDADREEVIDAVQGLLDALGISAEELADAAGNNSCGNDGNSDNSSSNTKDDKSSGAANSGCGQSEPTSSGQSGGATITIKGFSFGQPVTVAPGATVEVVNTDSAPHNVTAADKSFKTSTINQDEKATFTAPTTPGRYEFSCTIHPEMTGTLIVDAGGGQGRSRSSEPAMGSQHSGEHGGSGEHQSTTPGRENPSGGSSDGY